MKYSYIFLGLIMSFVLFVSLRTLTSQPRYFYDEAVVVETAHNLEAHGKLDIMVSPAVFSSYAHLFNSTGYTVTIPLAIIFKIFGVSLTAGRLLMVAWLIALIASVYFVIRKFWDEKSALAACALIASFAPFYGNGMQIMGEIPGFVFLIWGLWYLFEHKHYFFSGLFFGLAAISKPSIYGLIIPAFLIYLFFFQKDRSHKLIRFSAGAVGPLALYILLVVPHIFSFTTWKELIHFYRNPFESSSAFANISHNIAQYYHHTTILYFGLLTLVAVYAIYKNYNNFEAWLRNFYILSGIYIVFVFLYFLKSPGWFRYLVPAEFLILILIFPLINTLFKKRWLPISATFLIIGLQTTQLFLYRGDIKETYSQETARYVAQFHQSVAVINAPEVSSLLPEEQRYQVLKYLGVPQLGSNPLLLESNARTQIIVFKSADNPLVTPYQNILDIYYTQVNKIGSYRIFQLKPPVIPTPVRIKK